MKNQTKVIVFICLTLLFIGASMAEATAWKLSRNLWSEEDEKVYSRFVEALCDSKYSNLNRFIKDSKANPLYGEEDKKFNLSPDCADLPYILRAYVAYKLRLPFSYTASISGKGGDQRYSKGNKPTSFKDQDYFSSPQNLFSQVTLINSGYFRMAADSEDSDHYPVKISKKSIVPGTVYYDPDGHVAVVAKVTEDGRVRVIDAHPDRTISKPWFGAKFTRGSKTNGGGFKKWRPIRYTSGGNTVRTRNHNISDYSADDQFQKSYSFRGRSGLGYHEYIRQALTDENRGADPVRDFAFMMQDLYEDISYRAVAVNIAIEKGIHLKPHPGSLPWNIYGTDGLWEEFSTPSRDARLKVAFREFYDRSRQMVIEQEQFGTSGARELAARLLQKYDELSGQLQITYVNSAGRKMTLSFADVNARLFDLSFDPYHSIEFRWGARGDELASAGDGETKRRFYESERRLRNQLERVYNQATPLNMGPETPVDVDIRGWLAGFLQGQRVDSSIVAINREVVAPVASESSESNAAPAPETVELPVAMASAVTPPSVETVESDAAYEVPDHEINEEPPEDALIYNQPKIAEKENQVAAETETLPKPQPQSVAEKAPTALMQAQEKTYESSAPPLVGDMGIWGPLYNIGDGFAAAISEPEKSFSSH
ncbi:MAG TPA: hypothetical protein PLK58_06745 [Candidatus Rifleibacterium sp.]|nr:hypothetical protein [Candidatus Ozemobacteraceae bacterium]HPW58319.1 hypothetical protein [Candidatus Rifleibacterium sp.]